MLIQQSKYNQLPFTIQVGALTLWATELTRYRQRGRLRQLFVFNDFFAELAYNEQDVPCSIRTYSTYPLAKQTDHRLTVAID